MKGIEQMFEFVLYFFLPEWYTRSVTILRI